MIYIIRHGQSELNNRQLLQGRSDYPLNETGNAQAREAAARLKAVSSAAVYITNYRESGFTIPAELDRRQGDIP